jgi:hypothetical protein
MRLKNCILIPVTMILVLSSVNQASAQVIQPDALRQIQSLIDEKESRTPAQKKLDSQLWYAIKEESGQSITPLVATLEINVRKDNSGLVPVDIRGNVTNALIKAINDAGGEIIFRSGNLNTINARIPLLALEQIAALDDVRFIYAADRAYNHKDAGAAGFTDPGNKFFDDFLRMNGKPKLDALAIYSRKTFFNSYDSKHDNADKATVPFTFDFSPVVNSRVDFATRAARVRKQLSDALSDKKFTAGLPTGPVNSEGDVTHRADAARTFFGVNGSGVKIGVLSDGVNSLAAQQGLGELPAVTVLPGQAGSGNEGTAMLEIIYDLAPGAQLYFATAFTSQASFAQNILDLRTAGCDIIVDDVAYFREAVFQDDNVALSVNTVTAAGALYFSSAGNEGNKDDNSSGVWEGDFLNAGTGTVGTVVLAGGTVHDFGGGVLNDQITASNGGAPIGLFWSDQLGASGNDYDLYILDAGLTVVVNAATNVQDGNDDPVELSTISPGAGRRMVIFKKTAAAQRALHLNTFRGRLAISTTGQTHGHSSAVAAFSVAATPAAGSFGAPPNPTGPYPGVFNSANLTELFSSDGPRRVFYNPNGTAITPGNFLFGTGGGNVRQKPDITAADGTASGVSGFNPFYGTSAAAPHAAAIAGLIKSALPALTPAQIRTALTSSAIDIEAAGYDRDAGFGIVMAYEALVAAGAAPAALIVAGGATVVVESCSPGNGAIDPAETVTVSFCVQNTGGANTANLVGTLQATGGVTSPSGPQNYGVVVAGGPVVCRNFTFTASGACGSTITASIQFQDGAVNLGTITYTFTLGVGVNSTTTFSNATAITIPSAGAAVPYPSNIVVSGLTGTVNKVTVNLTGLNHVFPEDVGMLLVSPGGQKFVIMDGVIGGTPWVNINYTLDDAAATNIPKPGTPVSGTFKPTSYFAGDVFPPPAPGGPNLEPATAGSATFASAFNGINPNGTWSLYVFDFASGDAGSVSGGWGLSITTGTFTCCTPPICTLTCPANITVSNDPNQCGAVVNYPPPTTSGTCGTVTSSPASGSFFPVGTTTVTATSSAGPTCTFTVTVNDVQPPSITCPAPVTVSCASAVPPVNIGSVTASDNCPGVVVTHISDVISAQTCANRYTLTRTYRATDAIGNTASCTQVITVNDVTPPTLTCPAPVTVSCASLVPAPNIASVTGLSDNCGGVITVTHQGDVISAQTCANRYTITRTYRATDVCGNFAQCTQIITVNDVTAPVITCPANITVNATPGLCSAVVTFTVTATDNCTGAVTIVSVPASGSVFPVGTTTVTSTATDVCGNSSNCTFTVTVVDNQPPTIICPANITANNTPGLCSAVVTYPLPTAFDNCPFPGSVPLSITQNSSNTVTAGSVSCNAGGLHTDNSYWRAYDLGPMALTGPFTINSVTFGIELANAAGTGTTQPVTVRVYTSAGAFPGGVRTLVASQTYNIPDQTLSLFTATLAAAPTVAANAILVLEIFTPDGQAAGHSFFIGSNALPETAPSYLSAAACGVPNPVTVASLGFPNMHTIINAAGTVANPASSITQIAGIPSGGVFPVGVTTNTFRVTDASGNTATCSFTVTVVDNQAPTVTCPANIVANTNPGVCTATVATPNPTTADNCAVTTVTWVMTGATTGSSPATGINFVGTRTFNLNGTTGQGVTTITYTVKDAAGNTSTCSFTVTVNDVAIPVVGGQPTNQTVCVGTNAVFSVTATVPAGNPLTYQWQIWTPPVGGWVNIAGATNATLVLNAVTFSMNTNSYRVILTGLCSVVTSGVASLYVNQLPTVSILAAGPTALLPGQSVTLTAAVSPGGGSYQWFKNGVAIAGATGASLTGLTVDDIGSYTVRYTDLNGCVSTSAAMLVSGQVSNGLFIYPIPNDGHFHVRFYNQANEEATIRVFDMRGALVYLKKVTTTLPYTDIDVEMRNRITATEAYLVEVRGSNGRLIGAKKIIVFK